MHYVCVENNSVISVCDYQPSVPNTVRVIPISDEDNAKVMAGTHVFSVALGRVTSKSASDDVKVQEIKSSIDRYDFLQTTDWKVLRHIRQKALGVATSLTDAEYIELERQRQSAAESLTKPGI